MSKIQFLPVILFCIFTLVMISDLSAQDAVKAAEQAIDQVRQDFNAAYNKSDANTIANLLTDDVIWMPPNEPVVTGKAAVKTRYEGQFQKSNAQFEMRRDEIIVCSGWAFLRGPYTRTDIPKEGGDPKQIFGKYLMVFQHQADGSWKIARDIYNADGK
jgi:uncharacterized protein (TIGR02246 family)